MLQPHDDAEGAERVVVISHRMWANDFGGDRSVVGRTLQLRGLPYTIVGVAPPAYTGVIPLIIPELWLPISHVEEVEPAGINSHVPSPTGRTRIERRGSRWLFVKGRLKPGVTATTAHANMAVLGTQLAAAHPQTNRDHRVSAFATNDVRLLVPQAGGPRSMGSMGVMTVVSLVLLIACANVTGHVARTRVSASTRDQCPPCHWRQPCAPGSTNALRGAGAGSCRRGGCCGGRIGGRPNAACDQAADSRGDRSGSAPGR